MSLILPILVFAIFYLFIIRPKQAKLKAAQMEQQMIASGDRVLTRSGIYGRVSRISQDLAVVEVAPGLELVFDRRSVLKAPNTIDVDGQLSEENLAPEFSDDDFSQLHDHLEAHATDTLPSGTELEDPESGAVTGDDQVSQAGNEDHELPKTDGENQQ